MRMQNDYIIPKMNRVLSMSAELNCIHDKHVEDKMCSNWTLFTRPYISVLIYTGWDENFRGEAMYSETLQECKPTTLLV